MIFCDSKRSPTAELIPHHGSHDSTAKIRVQAAWSDEVKAVIWREIITEKIRKQAAFLYEIGKEKESELIESYIGNVELLDATNREGHAAKVYFNALFGMDFTRSADNAVNASLNYGYSLILSAFNREVSANGYLTQLGIFHNNMFNHFNLSCDLMEPFRPIVDGFVKKLSPETFSTEEKRKLQSLLNVEFITDYRRQTLLNTVKIYTKSVLEAIETGDISLIKLYKYEL